jgi:hypothetical protein
MHSSTHVPAVRGMWVAVVWSCHARHLFLLPFLDPIQPTLLGVESPRVWLLGARVRPQPGYEEGS